MLIDPYPGREGLGQMRSTHWAVANFETTTTDIPVTITHLPQCISAIDDED
jgi:hypothetical protein